MVRSTSRRTAARAAKTSGVSILKLVAALVATLCAVIVVGWVWLPTTMTLTPRSLPWAEQPCTPNDGEKWVLPHATCGTLRDGPFLQPCIGHAGRSVDLSEFEGHGLRQVAWLPDAGVAVAVADLEVESAGPNLEFFVSLDRGEHWLVRSFIKPSYEVTVDEVLIEWPNIDLRMRLDSPTFIATPWQRWYDSLRGEPERGPEGVYVARSTDGAQSFTLQRPWW